MIKDLPLIRCPICGTQYLPREIFMPEAVFGKQYDITKTESGEIKFYLGSDPDLEEEFVCDNCLTKLKITLKLLFTAETMIENNFEDDYVTEIDKPKKIKLDEEALF